jgi:hypothetical protein
MSKYIIIDEEAIQKRIEELENYTYATQNIYLEGKNEGELSCLLNLLSQSTPLIPEIDRAYWAGMQFVGEDKGSPNEYISNLKLDI